MALVRVSHIRERSFSGKARIRMTIAQLAFELEFMLESPD